MASLSRLDAGMSLMMRESSGVDRLMDGSDASSEGLQETMPDTSAPACSFC